MTHCPRCERDVSPVIEFDLGGMEHRCPTCSTRLSAEPKHAAVRVADAVASPVPVARPVQHAAPDNVGGILATLKARRAEVAEHLSRLAPLRAELRQLDRMIAAAERTPKRRAAAPAHLDAE